MICAGSASAQTQEAPDTSDGAQNETAFEFDAGLTVSEQFTDNVFATANDRRSDYITTFAPWAQLTFRAEDFRLQLEASAEIARFADYDDENYEDYFLGAEGLYRINEDVFAFSGIEFSKDHESRESPDDVNGTSPTEFRDIGGYFGLGGTWNERSFRIGVNVRDLNFDDTPAPGPDIDNDDRDRRDVEFGGRLGVAATEDGEFFVQGIYDERYYDQKVDDEGNRRSSDGYQAALGYTGSAGPLRGELLFGLMSRDYDDGSFRTTTTFDIGADVTLPLTPGTDLEGIVERSIEETTLDGASGYVSTSAGLRLRHRVSTDMSLAAYAFLTQNDYQGVNRNDVVTEMGVSLRYYLNPQVYLDTDYGFRQRQSDVAGAEFDEHRITLSLGTVLDPRFNRETATRAKTTGGGFYAGVQVGDLATHTKVDGPRGGPPTSDPKLIADFGDHEAAAGIFAGYRSVYGALVLGAEIEAEFNDTSWSHLANRDFSVERGNAYALTGTAGLRSPGDVLLYGRFGVISAKFDSTYQQGASTAVSKRSKHETGLLMGVGAEVPVGNGFSARMEYQLRAYDDYDIGAPSGSTGDDNFANVESVARVGLVYNFGGGTTPPDDGIDMDYSGFYAGAQLGHGTLQSDNTGPRTSGSGAAFTLDAIRAGQGWTGGVFAGYGVQTGSLYIGAEAEAEVSSVDWNQERSPEGRIYDLEKNSTFGAGIRLGYLLKDSVLIYGRAGVVRSKFDVDYNYQSASISRDKSLDGLRIGGGIEFPIGKSMTARFDYTHTNYDSHKVDYGTGVDKFDTEERVFRIGITRHF
jgi:hypothetical protein